MKSLCEEYFLQPNAIKITLVVYRSQSHYHNYVTNFTFLSNSSSLIYNVFVSEQYKK